jgi:hypothetical protein
LAQLTVLQGSTLTLDLNANTLTLTNPDALILGDSSSNSQGKLIVINNQTAVGTLDVQTDVRLGSTGSSGGIEVGTAGTGNAIVHVENDITGADQKLGTVTY